MAQTAASAATIPLREHREWPRYTADQPFTLSVRLDGRAYPCTVADVSLGGARLVFDDDLPGDPNSEIGIEISHPEAETVVCEAVWQKPREIGVQFDFSEDSLGLISACIRGITGIGQTATKA
ncbi:PilZ domain-containing protein [Pelagibius litoralis]|uniref:PilZ domain-containing protein n=1 Tax=Pelagibius litoralis TaxID=374515 RepID=A0A967CAF0_9PROT|nr:PilZ domain-containing protein [Pelagibius litoralis]NIA67633.1 PilZ domain-containing protein [Pelagibius litoralis]